MALTDGAKAEEEFAFEDNELYTSSQSGTHT